MSILSSVLGETKIFFFIIALTGIPAILLYSFKRNKFFSGILLSFILAISILGFIQLYDVIFNPQGGFLVYLRLDNLISYLSWSADRPGGVIYIGRLAQFDYVWKQITQSPLTLWLGQGIGALETSNSLGISGISLLMGDFGVFGANSLTGLIGDFGLIGISIVFILFIKIALGLLFTRSNKNQEALNMGLIIFIFTIPLWMFYMDIWTTPITMLIFWFSLGQSFRMVKDNENKEVPAHLLEKVNHGYSRVTFE
jgi:hypothetical protein